MGTRRRCLSKLKWNCVKAKRVYLIQIAGTRGWFLAIVVLFLAADALKTADKCVPPGSNTVTLNRW